MPAKHVLKLSLSDRLEEAIAKLAAANSVSPARMAVMLLEEHLFSQQAQETTTNAVEAEQQLCRWVQDECLTLVDSEWSENITLQMFQRIEREKLALYQAATALGDSARINREIGVLIKQTLNAQTMQRDTGRPWMVAVKPSESSLIKAYTRLEPSTIKADDA